MIEQKPGSDNRGKSPLFKFIESPYFKYIIAPVAGALVSLGIVSGLSFNAWQDEVKTRKALLTEFQDETKDYILWGDKARIDVYEKGYDHMNKSDNMTKWEAEHFSAFTKVLDRVDQECRDNSCTALKRLRCANTRFYSCYDAMKHKASLSYTVKNDRLKRRLEADCGSSEWSILTNIGDRNDLETLNQEAREQHRELEATQAFAVRAIWEWSEVSHIKYMFWRVKQYFVH